MNKLIALSWATQYKKLSLRHPWCIRRGERSNLTMIQRLPRPFGARNDGSSFKRAIHFFAGLLVLFLVSACTPVIQTVESTRIVQPTVIVVQSATPGETPTPPPSLDQAYPPPITPTPLRTLTFTATPFVKFTQKSPTLTAQQVSDKIAACYHVEPDCSACKYKSNNSIHQVVGTTRMFINLPKQLYPKYIFRYATTVSGNASMGWISNGGLPGEALDGSPACWSTYVELDGQGEVDLRIPSILVGVPDYFVRFMVEPPIVR